MDAGLFSKLLNEKFELKNCSFILPSYSKKEINSEICESLKFSLDIEHLKSLALVRNYSFFF